MASGPRVLVVATKCPWPPTDGGRLVLAETLRAVADAGAEVTLVCPQHEDSAGAAHSARNGVEAANHVVVARRALPWIYTLLRPGTPATIVRQTNDASLEAVERLVAERPFDVAHAEQLQAMPMLAPARQRGIPIVLRAQNVESDLWTAAASAMPLAAPWLLFQAALLRRWEGRAVASAAATAALTETDSRRLSNLASGRGEVVHLAAPFPERLEAGDPLPGTPALAIAAGGWSPNHDGARWFVERVWPLVLDRLPAAQLHLFGADGKRLPRAASAHRRAAESSSLFPTEGMHVVPVRVASGVRMKILEAWSRGVPVVATEAAAAGLEDGAESALLRESDPAALALAIEKLAHDPDRRKALVVAGRRQLARHHDPSAIGARWLELYRYVAR
ncbi:MAG TPA: glycosyltransferase family 4 protein [Thermoanaerobaculia bacterium]|nr:glycosyltransferase family 4 protein [Thermoanaerobaculia bacterium]